MRDWPLVVQPDSVVGMNAPRIHLVLSDHLGTPRKVLDGATGQTRWSWDAKDPFGHELPQENPENLGVFVFDLRFPGQQFDKETGLFHNGFRTYSPKWGDTFKATHWDWKQHGTHMCTLEEIQ